MRSTPSCSSAASSPRRRLWRRSLREWSRKRGWVEGLRADQPEFVAIDGKTSRRCHARARGREALHLVSAWADGQRLVLGQEAVAGRSNEITAIPLLLERLELAGALVTIDAIGCQTRIAQAVQAKQADYLLAVKANWPALHAEIERYFADAPAAACDRLETTDGDHGRIEVRRHAVSRDVAWLTTDRRHPGEPRFPGLTAVAMVEAEVERAGTTTIARRFYLSSARLDAATFARAVRSHWGIENACTGSWTWSSTTTSPGCAPATGLRTWPPSDTWPSISCATPTTSTASRSAARKPPGARTTSKPSSAAPRESLHAIAL